MTDYLYEGPAVLAINDAEIDVYARLAVLQSRGVDDTTWWANLAFHPLKPPTEDTPCTLRLPGGWKWDGRIPAGSTCMLGNSPPPARVQPPTADTTMIPTAELDQMRQEIARVRALHPNRDEAHAQQNALCIECASPAPCRTRRALDGEAPDA